MILNWIIANVTSMPRTSSGRKLWLIAIVTQQANWTSPNFLKICYPYITVLSYTLTMKPAYASYSTSRPTKLTSIWYSFCIFHSLYAILSTINYHQHRSGADVSHSVPVQPGFCGPSNWHILWQNWKVIMIKHLVSDHSE